MRYLMQNNAKLFSRAALLVCPPHWATSLSLFTFHALEKEMATHSSVLAWRIPGTGEPGGLPSLWSHKVGHDWSDLAAAAAAVYKTACWSTDFWHLERVSQFCALYFAFSRFFCLLPFFSSIELMKNSSFPFSSLTSFGVVRYISVPLVITLQFLTCTLNTASLKL